MSDETDIAEEPARMLFGIKLAPFSWGRRAALQRLIAEDVSTGEAALSVIWLCSKSAEECDAIRGPDAKRQARLEMEAFAETNSLRPKSKAEKLMLKTANQIYDDYLRAQFTTAGGGGGGDPGNALG